MPTPSTPQFTPCTKKELRDIRALFTPFRFDAPNAETILRLLATIDERDEQRTPQLPVGLTPDRLVVTELQNTCDVCPSQWEGTLADGRCVYIRYRAGRLGFGIGATVWGAVEDWNTRDDRKIGDDLDGSMTDEEMESHLSDVFDFSTTTYLTPR